MPIKLILCPFGGEVCELFVLASAFQIAAGFEAGLRVLHVAPPPPFHSAASRRLHGTEDLLEAADRDMMEISERYTRQYAGRADMTFRVDGAEASGLQQADVLFRACIGNLEGHLPIESRTCDLILMGFDNQPDGRFSDVIAALFRTRRPALLVPRSAGAVVAATGWPKTVAVAWDGSSSSAQALRDAMPFLVAAAEIFVLHVAEPGKDADDTDLKAYLRRHGVAAEFLHIPRENESVAETLLARVRALDARLLVMGTFGHGRVTEMVLGGATDFMLKHAHIPLLMAH